MSQNKQILNHLMKGNRISAVLAVKLWNCYRLAARINDLRNKGHNIVSERVSHNDKYFSLYHLKS